MSDVSAPGPLASRTQWWVRLLPDTRAFVTFGMLALAWRMLEMIDSEPKLLENPAFMTLATLVIGGSGLGAAVSYFYGSSRSADKQTSDTVATLTAVATNQQSNGAPPLATPSQEHA